MTCGLFLFGLSLASVFAGVGGSASALAASSPAPGRQITVARDGSGDYTTIAAAIAAAHNRPASIHVRAGTYVLTSELHLAAGTVLVGDGTGTVIQAPINARQNAI